MFSQVGNGFDAETKQYRLMAAWVVGADPELRGGACDAGDHSAAVPAAGVRGERDQGGGDGGGGEHAQRHLPRPLFIGRERGSESRGKGTQLKELRRGNAGAHLNDKRERAERESRTRNLSMQISC